MSAQADAPAKERARLSAFVVAYNREETIGTCLRALAFADELIVIDKGSTDPTVAIAETLADRVIRVPWSPTVEDTRAFALEQCTHDWVLFLDDDECLSVEAVRYLDAELRDPRGDIYLIPQRHYIVGRHDERAYYWPEHQVRFFRRGSLSFTRTVHHGWTFHSENLHIIPADSGACIHHFSHRDVGQWIEKANRYTSQTDRQRVSQQGAGIGRFARARLDHWLARTKPGDPDGYPEAVAVLRTVYDLIDRLKTWEEEDGQDGAALFRAGCARLDAAYAAELPALARPHGPAGAVVSPIPAPPPPAARSGEATLQRAALAALRDGLRAQREAVDEARSQANELRRWVEAEQRRVADAERRLAEFALHHEQERASAQAEQSRHHDDLARLADANARLRDALAATEAAARARAAAYEASTSWRLTAPVRALAKLMGRG